MDINSCKILVLKNAEAARSVTRNMLVKIGAAKDNIYLAETVEQAKTILTDTAIELILSGIGTAEEEAPELMDWMKKNNRRERVIFILYSGGGEDYVEKKANELGAEWSISIPVDLKFFAKVIEHFVEKRK